MTLQMYTSLKPMSLPLEPPPAHPAQESGAKKQQSRRNRCYQDSSNS